MTQLRQQALKRLSTSPVEQQENIARLILDKIEQKEDKNNQNNLFPRSF